MSGYGPIAAPDVRDSTPSKADAAFRAHPLVNRLNLACRIAQLDQRTVLPDQCLHLAEAVVRLPRRKSGFVTRRPTFRNARTNFRPTAHEL
jgi:hypothetical protein